MSNEHGNDETTVFASAKLVSPADLVESETETAGETKTPKSETRTKAEVKTTGVPPWHLSAALGLTLALIGGVVLWLQSPLLAVVVIGGLVVLVGLGLALRHFFRSETVQRRRATRSQGSEGAGGGRGGTTTTRSQQSPSKSQDRSRRKGQDRQPETNPTKRRPWSRDPETRQRRQSRQSETGGRTRSRDRSQDRSQSPAGPRGNDGRTGGRTPQGGRTQTHVNPGPQGPRSTGGRPMIPTTSGPRVPDNWPPRPLAGTLPATSKPDQIDPLKTKDKKKKGDKKNPSVPDVPKVAPAKESRSENAVKTTTPDIAWPNVDLDHYTPVKAHNMPRITIPRKAVKLPPIYHRQGEPQWPVDDPDTVPPKIPDQRNRRSEMTTVDMLPKVARDAHLDKAAQRALASAAERAVQAHEFRALAQETAGMDDLRQDHEQHLLNASKAAHDAAVREEVVHLIADYKRRH